MWILHEDCGVYGGRCGTCYIETNNLDFMRFKVSVTFSKYVGVAKGIDFDCGKQAV